MTAPPSCPMCEGTGKDVFDTSMTCPMCKGSGACPIYSALSKMAQQLIGHAAAVGYVVLIEQRALVPLAMGHYETIIDLRPERRPA